MASRTSSGPVQSRGRRRAGGRLELTWANKDMRLLSHDDVSYEWVDPLDWRVAEVRLLEEVTTVGAPDSGNLLVQGDALHALTALTSLPQYAARYVGKVKLCYLDPPFNTGKTFANYDDAVEHSVWLTMLRDRLLQARRLLRPDGSVWLHLDDAEAHRARSVLDEVFGASNFVATVVWEKAPGAKGDTDIAASHDYIHVYAADKTKFKSARNLLTRTDQQMKRYANPDGDPRGVWRQGADGTAKSGGEDARWEITLPSGRVVKPPKGSYWRFSKETFQNARAEGRVYFGRDGNGLPIIKTYLASAKDGVVPHTWWSSDEVGSNQEAKRDHIRKLFPEIEPFATPKPERLLQRIIHIATDPGDVVLDCFGGSGTTAAVAHKMNRRWVLVEQSSATVDTFVIPRLSMVVAGKDPYGITSVTREVLDGDLPDDVDDAVVRAAAGVMKDLFDHGTFAGVGGVSQKMVLEMASAMRKASKVRKEVTKLWEGGGGFLVAAVGPSMFEDYEGTTVLAEWATGGALAEAVAAQLKFPFDPSGPFAGKKGRSRLAVLDGMLTCAVADYLAGQLEERETLLVVAQALEPGVEDHVRALRPGSRARKVPRDLAAVGRKPSHLVKLGAAPDRAS